jgi:hypothetical protein
MYVDWNYFEYLSIIPIFNNGPGSWIWHLFSLWCGTIVLWPSVNQYCALMVLESKGGGELIISFLRHYPLFYSHGQTPPHITYFVTSSCGSTSTSVRCFVKLNNRMEALVRHFIYLFVLLNLFIKVLYSIFNSDTNKAVSIV